MTYKLVLLRHGQSAWNKTNQITGVKLHSADLDSAQLTAYPLVDTQQIRWEN